METILITDDDMHIGNMLEELLTAEGFGVQRAYSGTEALMKIDSCKPDLVLLDLMLPGLCGEEVLPRIKGIPVIVMSAKTGVSDKVDMLLGGAADYVTKPFSTDELLARITAVLRCKKPVRNGGIMAFSGIEISTDTRSVTVSGKPVKLTRTEYAILKLLMSEPSKVFPKNIILDRISSETPDCVESSLKVHISNLRRKLKEVSGIDYIDAVWGIGFKMHQE